MDTASAWTVAFLGVVAASTLTLAVGAVVVAVQARRFARRLEQAVADLQADVRPLVARATAVTDEAARITGLVAHQVERADAVLADVLVRLDELSSLVQTAIVRPAREIVGVVAAVRAVIDTLRGLRQSGSGERTEEEEALFIG